MFEKIKKWLGFEQCRCCLRHVKHIQRVDENDGYFPYTVCPKCGLVEYGISSDPEPFTFEDDIRPDLFDEVVEKIDEFEPLTNIELAVHMLFPESMRFPTLDGIHVKWIKKKEIVRFKPNY